MVLPGVFIFKKLFSPVKSMFSIPGIAGEKLELTSGFFPVRSKK